MDNNHETDYLLSIPGMRKRLDEGIALSIEDCEDFDFSEEILADLINQGYAGEKLLSEFKKVTHQVRPAIEKIIEEADALAKSSAENYSDPTDAIFGTDELTYLAVLEPSADGYGVYFPDLPGCISFEKNIEDTIKMAREALDIHIYEMEKDGDDYPHLLQ